jgi:WD40 repeat protein
VVREFKDHDRGVKAISFLPDGKAFVSVGDDGIARLWDLNTGELIRKFDVGGR